VHRDVPARPTLARAGRVRANTAVVYPGDARPAAGAIAMLPAIAVPIRRFRTTWRGPPQAARQRGRSPAQLRSTPGLPSSWLMLRWRCAGVRSVNQAVCFRRPWRIARSPAMPAVQLTADENAGARNPKATRRTISAATLVPRCGQSLPPTEFRPALVNNRATTGAETTHRLRQRERVDRATRLSRMSLDTRTANCGQASRTAVMRTRHRAQGLLLPDLQTSSLKGLRRQGPTTPDLASRSRCWRERWPSTSAADGVRWIEPDTPARRRPSSAVATASTSQRLQRRPGEYTWSAGIRNPRPRATGGPSPRRRLRRSTTCVELDPDRDRSR